MRGRPRRRHAALPGEPHSAELRIGDEVVALDGESVEGSDFRPERAYRRTRPGDKHALPSLCFAALDADTLTLPGGVRRL